MIQLIPGTVTFYREKQKRRGWAEEKFVEAIKISPAEGETYRCHAYDVLGLTPLLS
jgi:hypothetical protein